MKIGAIVQARTSSTRFPKKVLMDLPYNSGITVLEQVINRLKQSKYLDTIIIATTNDKEDDKIVKIANNMNVNYYRGNKFNVLERYYEAAKNNDLDIIIRITSDCPCIDYTLMDNIIKSHIKNSSDYTSNKIGETYPIGLDVEVFNFDVLEIAFLNAQYDYEKEHVTPYIYKTAPEKFKINPYISNENNSNLRVTLDTFEDYSLLCCIYDNLYEINNFFTLEDILKLFNEKPWIKTFNRNILQKKVLTTLNEELEELIKVCEIQDLNKAKNFIEKEIK